MNIHHALFAGLGLAIAASLAWTDQPAPSTAAAVPPVLTWTTDTQSWQGTDWDAAVIAAANHVEQGFTDWRLPTVPELQAAVQIPAGQPGSWGMDAINLDGTMRGWTSRSSGVWAYAVRITTVGGVVVPAQSGQSQKVLKSSSFPRTKFVRP